MKLCTEWMMWWNVTDWLLSDRCQTPFIPWQLGKNSRPHTFVILSNQAWKTWVDRRSPNHYASCIPEMIHRLTTAYQRCDSCTRVSFSIREPELSSSVWQQWVSSCTRISFSIRRSELLSSVNLTRNSSDFDLRKADLFTLSRVGLQEWMCTHSTLNDKLG